ncbi:formin-binding protein 4-like [Lepisosteus oculatus]|uniref:formin-binding protein 4-like n=1 Tax=Lepisosteus oculatus TaxID=7918 RepID=UPI00371959EC
MSEIRGEVLQLLSQHPRGLRICDFTGAYNNYFGRNLVLSEHGFKKLTGLFTFLTDRVEIVEDSGTMCVRLRSPSPQCPGDEDPPGDGQGGRGPPAARLPAPGVREEGQRSQEKPRTKSYRDALNGGRSTPSAAASSTVSPSISPGTSSGDPMSLLKASLGELLRAHPGGLPLARVRKSCLSLLHHPDLLVGHSSVRQLLESLTDVVRLQGIGVQTCVLPAHLQPSSPPQGSGIPATVASASPPLEPGLPPSCFPELKGTEELGKVGRQPAGPLPSPPAPSPPLPPSQPSQPAQPSRRPKRRSKGHKKSRVGSDRESMPSFTFGSGWEGAGYPASWEGANAAVEFWDEEKDGKAILRSQSPTTGPHGRASSGSPDIEISHVPPARDLSTGAGQPPLLWSFPFAYDTPVPFDPVQWRWYQAQIEAFYLRYFQSLQASLLPAPPFPLQDVLSGAQLSLHLSDQPVSGLTSPVYVTDVGPVPPARSPTNPSDKHSPR